MSLYTNLKVRASAELNHTVHLTMTVNNAQVISEDVGMTLDKADMTALGRAKKATVTKEDTILLDGGGNKGDIEERNEQLRQAISASTSDYDR